ncbi:uncharacterized protein [Atheta coriaria]|uniref:uncharacterized protein isoform X2 n=1 Tax=Dalotia coriaria TaxID=877792 RepID=UPI0031F4738E
MALYFLNLGESVSDMNMAHFQYISNNLGPAECRKLVASLHFSNSDLPNALQPAERKVLKDDSCLKQLMQWNMDISGRQGATHEILVRRLKQINREDLALWLTNAAFNAMNKSLQAISSDKSMRMYEPVILPYVNYSTSAAEITQPGLKVTTPESLIRIVKQNVPDPVEDVVIDPTEWTIFDTISWSIVLILFLLIIVLLIYLTLASPCNRKKRCQCSVPSSPREYNLSNRSSPVSCVRAPILHQQENKPHPQRHFESPIKQTTYIDGKNMHSFKKHPNEYSICGSSECPALTTCHCDCSNPRCKREFQNDFKRQAQFSESPSYNDITAYNPYEGNCSQCKVPPAPRPICHGGSTCLGNEYTEGHIHHNGARTIDIHQKIAIPMNNMDNSN